MIGFNVLPDDASALDLCPLLRVAQMTLQYAVEHGGIDLTQTKAFKRTFVHWAAARVDWPGMGYEELFRYNKVLNEYEFPPVEMTHFLLTKLKLGRHYKGSFKATKKGAELAEKHGQLFDEVIPFFLLSIDHASYSRFQEAPIGNWDTWLNVINVEADHGANEKHLFRTFHGYDASWASGNWREAAAFSSCVLKPLEWAGLMDHVEIKGEDGDKERHYIKTDLWRSALSLETDMMLKPIQRH